MACVGVISWFELGSIWNKNTLEDDKFYHTSSFVNDHLCIPMLVYQMWNVVICVLLNDLRDPIMIGHHIVTAALAYTATIFAHYYSCFFFGVTEITNIPLTLMDVFDHFPEFKAKYPTIKMVTEGMFAIMFFIVRIFMWTNILFHYIQDSYILIVTGTAHSNFVLLFNIVCSLFLTGLQFMWARQIIIAIRDTLSPKDKKKG